MNRLVTYRLVPRNSVIRMWRLPAAALTASTAASNTTTLRRSRAVRLSFSSDASSNSETTTKGATMYLHVGPGGDCWTGHSIFAAKHLQPDYVRSIVIPPGMDPSTVVSVLEEDTPLAQEIYDTQKLPSDLSDRIKTFEASDER